MKKPLPDLPGTPPLFQMRPQVAAKNNWARIETLHQNRAFIEKYRTALGTHIDRLTDVGFLFD